MNTFIKLFHQNSYSTQWHTWQERNMLVNSFRCFLAYRYAIQLISVPISDARYIHTIETKLCTSIKPIDCFIWYTLSIAVSYHSVWCEWMYWCHSTNLKRLLLTFILYFYNIKYNTVDSLNQYKWNVHQFGQSMARFIWIEQHI